MIDLNSDSLERKSRIQSALVTVVIQVLLFLAFYFMVVWERPDPPVPTYGLELNLGFSDFGSGESITPSPSSEELTSTDDTPAPGEIAPPSEALPPSSKKTPSKSELSKNKAVGAQPSPIKGESEASPPSVKEEPKESATNQKVEAPKVDQRALFGAGGRSGKGFNPNNVVGQGNTTVSGDQGKTSGTVEGKALLGTGSGQGTTVGQGYSLDLAGWDFASKPTINDRVSTRNGRIVFKITVDGSGKVIQALPFEYNVSNEVLAYYRQVVNQLDFKKSGGATAEFSSGKITFVIKVE